MGIGGKGVTTVPPITTVGGPSVVRTFPAITHRFAARPYLPSGITFARDSTVNGWTLDANGDPVLTSFAVDEPAFVIDPATGQSLGYRALAGFTNSLLDNRDLSTGNWSSPESPVLSQDSTGLDGVANTAWTITDDNGADGERIEQSITVPDDSNPHTLNIFVEKDSDETRFPAIALRLQGGSTILRQVTQFNTRTGALSDVASDGTSSIKDCGNWWRVTVTITNNGSGNTTLNPEIFPAHGDSFGSFSNAATGSIVYDFGGVYLNSSIAGPPIETEGSPVSTAADDASEPLPASCQDGFVWVVHARTPPDASSSRYVGSITTESGSFNELVRIRNSAANTINFQSRASGSQIYATNAAVTQGEDFKAAFRAEDGRWAVAVNGVLVDSGTDSGFPSGLAVKNIGQFINGDFQLQEAIAYDALYDNPADWTDSDLQNASTL